MKVVYSVNNANKHFDELDVNAINYMNDIGVNQLIRSCEYFVEQYSKKKDVILHIRLSTNYGNEYFLESIEWDNVVLYVRNIMYRHYDVMSMITTINYSVLTCKHLMEEGG